jgi:Eukaryotic aspartyl protease
LIDDPIVSLTHNINNSQLILGRIPDRYSIDSYIWLDIYLSKWDFNNSKLSIRIQNRIPDEKHPLSYNVDMTLSGLPFIGLPPSPFREIEAYFYSTLLNVGKQYSSNCMLTIEGYIHCKNINPIENSKLFPVLTFSLSNKINISVTGIDYTEFSSDNREFTVRIKMNNENHVILGSPFLSRVELVLDYENKRIGLGEYVYYIVLKISACIIVASLW